MIRKFARPNRLSEVAKKVGMKYREINAINGIYEIKEILTIFVELDGILAAKACFNLRSRRSKRSAVVQAS